MKDGSRECVFRLVQRYHDGLTFPFLTKKECLLDHTMQLLRLLVKTEHHGMQ